MIITRQSDILKAAAEDVKVNGHGRNFKSLVAAGSWTIYGFHYGKSKCACCGRPICRILQLKNESHQENNGFAEVIDIGVICGPKVFTESCVGFYSDPTKEWERQHRVWKDYINYVILCVKHDAMWKLVPEELRCSMDDFLQEGYKAQEHSGGWWMIKDAKKRFLKSQSTVGVIPSPRVLYAASRGLMYSAKKQKLVPSYWELKCDYNTGVFNVEKIVPDTLNF